MARLTRLRSAAAAPYRFLCFIGVELWVPISMSQINAKVRTAPVDTTAIEALSDGDLKKLIESEWTRGKELDDKLQKLTAALSVSVTVGELVGSTMLQDLVASGWKIAAAVLFLLATVLLLTGVLIGLNGLKPKPRYGYGASYMEIIAAGGDTARKEMVAAARYFERDNRIRANEAFAANVSIHNGVLTFAAAMFVGMVAAALGKTDTDGAAHHRARSDLRSQLAVPATRPTQYTLATKKLNVLKADQAQIREAAAILGPRIGPPASLSASPPIRGQEVIRRTRTLGASRLVSRCGRAVACAHDWTTIGRGRVTRPALVTRSYRPSKTRKALCPARCRSCYANRWRTPTYDLGESRAAAFQPSHFARRE